MQNVIRCKSSNIELTSEQALMFLGRKTSQAAI